jgi:D-serine deaminase-like pyridoxal phosphate-dependent protein
MLKLDDITRPTLILDVDTAKANISRMADKADEQGIYFRPHFKTHQSAQIGEWFRNEGVSGITVSSLEMARYFAAAGWRDITIAFPVNMRQIPEIDAFPKEVRLNLVLESVEPLSRMHAETHISADIWIKVDAGSLRTGLNWQDVDRVQQLLLALHSAPALTYRGLLTHAGHSYACAGPDEIRRTYTDSVERMIWLEKQLTKRGFPKGEISVGDTPGCTLSESLGDVDEIRPGNFIFFDAHQYHLGVCGFERIAVAVACPVVALHPERSEAVLYGGAIHLSKDFELVDGEHHYGLVCKPENGRWGQPLEGAYMRMLSQEHGVAHLQSEDLESLKVGDLLYVIPAHSCLTVQCLGEYLTLDGQRITTLETRKRY